ncbi:MAG: hypothetical protein H6978_01760 [Gammaproteobacteria bacterium]|nr:hypothetical protein [Gammaproteobacteria bacterium]
MTASNIGHTGNVIVEQGPSEYWATNAIIDRSPPDRCRCDPGPQRLFGLDSFTGNGRLRLGTTTADLTLGNVDTTISGDIGNAPDEQAGATLTKFGGTTVALHRATGITSQTGAVGGTFITSGTLKPTAAVSAAHDHDRWRQHLLFNQTFNATATASISGDGVSCASRGSSTGHAVQATKCEHSGNAGRHMEAWAMSRQTGAIMDIHDLDFVSGTLHVGGGGRLVPRWNAARQNTLGPAAENSRSAVAATWCLTELRCRMDYHGVVIDLTATGRTRSISFYNGTTGNIYIRSDERAQYRRRRRQYL